MLTHSTRCFTCSSDAITAWRRDCSSTPLRASMSTSARSAVDAPVTMLRVYCTWPGRVGDDELAARRREVAVRDVDRDALLALGAQAVGEQREVRVVEAPVAARALDRLELVLEDLLGVEQQAPDERALAVVDRARGREAEQSPSWLEVPLALAVFHGGFGELVVGAGRAALGDARRRDLDDDLRRRSPPATRPRRCTTRRRRCGSAPSSPRAPRRPAA